MNKCKLFLAGGRGARPTGTRMMACTGAAGTVTAATAAVAAGGSGAGRGRIHMVKKSLVY